MFLQRAWYRAGVDWRLWLLLPLHGLFVAVSWLRQQLYRSGVLTRYCAPVPVIIIGNISVGGTGKTPVTQAVIQWLQQHGYHPAILSRGYGGAGPFPQLVRANSDANKVGDEPRLLAARTQAPVVVGPNRAEAIQWLLQQHPEVDIIVSDDGLQHYALARDIEIVVIDGERGFGNGWRLPLGPLREPLKRLSQVDFLVQNGATTSSTRALAQHHKVWQFDLQPEQWRRVCDQSPAELAAGRYAAVAGIGNPQRFFDTLQEALSATNIVVDKTYAFADHHPFKAADFAKMNAHDGVLMTEKDASKCQSFAAEKWFYLPVSAVFPLEFWQQFAARVQTRVTRNDETTRSSYGG